MRGPERTPNLYCFHVKLPLKKKRRMQAAMLGEQVVGLEAYGAAELGVQ
jgi:hypothetical protein